jgi:single-strand DNA-binding protein
MLQLNVIGNLGNDAIVKEINNQKTITFSVAINQSWKDKEGIKHEKTTWVNCAMWNKEKTDIVNYLKKGCKVYIQGLPEINNYINDKNEHVSSLNLSVKLLEFLDKKEKV